MCALCVEACHKHFPDCPDEKIVEFLNGATAYPVAGPEMVERQLVEAKAAGCATWQGAMCYADELLTKWEREFYGKRECDEMMHL